MSYGLAFACPSCGQPVEGPLAADTVAMTCAACGAETSLPEAAETATSAPVSVCPVCGGRDLYAQRDFRRSVGLAIAGVGLLLGPFTMWISTVVAIALDALLYLVVPVVTVCYACNAQLRGVPKTHRPAPFDIAVHDVYKFNRRHPPRRERAVAGPLETRRRRNPESSP